MLCFMVMKAPVILFGARSCARLTEIKMLNYDPKNKPLPKVIEKQNPQCFNSLLFSHHPVYKEVFLGYKSTNAGPVVLSPHFPQGPVL